jgi:uncharacterized damage-inducible protein DinB
MESDDVVVLLRYHVRANERILETTAALSEEEFRRPAVLDHGTAFQTLRHMVDVDWSWREFCQGNDVGQTYLWETGEPLEDLESIRSAFTDEHARMLAYAGSLDRAGMEQQLTQTSPQGPSFPRWLVLAHVVNHGTQHRSEMARYLTECGHSPGDIDLL